MATFLCNTEHDKSKKGCPISSKSVIFGLEPKIHFVAMQEIAVSSTAMTHTYWSSPFNYIYVFDIFFAHIVILITVKVQKKCIRDIRIKLPASFFPIS